VELGYSHPDIKAEDQWALLSLLPSSSLAMPDTGLKPAAEERNLRALKFIVRGRSGGLWKLLACSGRDCDNLVTVVAAIEALFDVWQERYFG
jgi:hypothetical protein